MGRWLNPSLNSSLFSPKHLFYGAKCLISLGILQFVVFGLSIGGAFGGFIPLRLLVLQFILLAQSLQKH